MYRSMFLWVYVYMCVYSSLCVCIRAHMYFCVSLGLCGFMHVCDHVHMCVCECVYNSTGDQVDSSVPILSVIDMSSFLVCMLHITVHLACTIISSRENASLLRDLSVILNTSCATSPQMNEVRNWQSNVPELLASTRKYFPVFWPAVPYTLPNLHVRLLSQKNGLSGLEDKWPGFRPGAFSDSSLSTALLCKHLGIWGPGLITLPSAASMGNMDLGLKPERFVCSRAIPMYVRQVYVGILLRLKQLYLGW